MITYTVYNEILIFTFNDKLTSMKKTSLFIVHLIITLFTANLQGQIFDPVKWTFDIKVVSNDEVDLVFNATIEPGWHLYGHYIPDNGPVPTTFTLEESENYEISGKLIEVTKGEKKYDESFDMTLTLFSNTATFKQRIKVKSAADFSLSGFVQFMCCDDEKCLPPKDVDFELTIKGATLKVVEVKKEQSVDVETNQKNEKTQDEELDTSTSVEDGIMIVSQNNKVEDTILSENDEDEEESESLLWFFIKSIAKGIVGLFMPCVFPMIPITISFFLRGNITRTRGIINGLFFSISLIFLYTSLGLIVSLSSAGADLANTLATHWIPNLIFFIFFVVFAVSFFGMFELILPGSLANKVDKQADRKGLIGIFFMALSLTIVSFSCIGPLVGEVLFKASQGEVLLPTLGMLGFSLGLAVPFSIFTIFPSTLKNLPKSGGWLNVLKVVLGFIILASSLEFLHKLDQDQSFFTREIFLSLWIALFILLGLYLLGKFRLPYDSETKHIVVPRFLLAFFSFAFVIYMIPGMFGAPLKMISSIIPPKTNHSFDLVSLIQNNQGSKPIKESAICGTPKYSDILHLPHGLEGYFDYEEGLQCAIEQNKPVFLDFTGHLCSNCRKMEAKVWSDPQALEILKEEYIIIALYTDDNTKLPEEEWVTSEYDGKAKKTLGKKNLDFEITYFNSNAQPLYFIIDHEGNKLTKNPFSVNLKVHDFIDFLNEGIQNFKP